MPRNNMNLDMKTQKFAVFIQKKTTIIGHLIPNILCCADVYYTCQKVLQQHNSKQGCEEEDCPSIHPSAAAMSKNAESKALGMPFIRLANKHRNQMWAGKSPRNVNLTPHTNPRNTEILFPEIVQSSGDAS